MHADDLDGASCKLFFSIAHWEHDEAEDPVSEVKSSRGARVILLNSGETKDDGGILIWRVQCACGVLGILLPFLGCQQVLLAGSRLSL